MSHMQTADIVARLVFDWSTCESQYDRPRDIYVEIDVADVTVFVWKFEGQFDWHDPHADGEVISEGLNAFAKRLREVLQP